ncbi:MAG: ATP-binding protein [Nanoarchaeota archaeon]|nr:ATP-binding protein [Nanoarchaeota archaeon]MBU1270090.1 ATP-binding protein [Nanoarchaeota archaeon]MBU1603914.1 ATP-binding protein [Nanoarchaeota archaeon]MBU2443426.1 ATP-binding protein [Nanoarchaeota archaeon]
MRFIESETLELKKSTSELKEAVISIVAMLNKHSSGKLIFGISPKGEVLGQDVSEKTIRTVSQKIANSIEPKIYPEV